MLSYSEQLDLASKDRFLIKEALKKRLSPIPCKFWHDYLRYQKYKQNRFLFQINILAMLAYLFFGIADYFVLPDIGLISLKIRCITIVCFSVFLYLMFKYCKDIKILDLYLPYCCIVATLIWFGLLSQSSDPNRLTFQYASVIFIILANLSVQVLFLPSLIPSAIIVVTSCVGAYYISGKSADYLFIYSFAYFPIVMFSLYISWNSTLKNRQVFLNTLLDENNRRALNQMAHTDALTSLHNRRYFEVLAQQHIDHSRIQRYPLCLLLFDVDHFKKINDNYGHDIGDEILKLIAQVAQQNVRSEDVLARFGSEEFIMLLSNTTERQAQVIAERICNQINLCNFVFNESHTINFTISIGFAKFLPSCHDLRRLIKCADMALYTAKQQGRNRVVMHHNPT